MQRSCKETQLHIVLGSFCLLTSNKICKIYTITNNFLISITCSTYSDGR